MTAFGAATMAVAGLALVPSSAQASTGAVIPPVKECVDLKGNYDIPGAKTRITDATVVPAGAEPAHCDVRGVIEPAVQFQLKLPTTTFTGRYVQYGCGGFCGLILPPPFPNCGVPAGGDAAVAATDDGHVGKQEPEPFLALFDGTWAANNQAARNDWQFRAPHVLSLAAKRVIATFYGAPPRVSYFNGCSNGGREALLLAQRYPHDFDGIIAAAPAAYIGPLVLYQAWIARANMGVGGAPILTPEKVTALHNAVVAACDRLDGLADEQIEDPRLCRFDPGTIQCAPGTDGGNCLTAAQVEAARKLYAGPTDAHGRRLYPGWQSRGSELAWIGWIIPAPPLPAPASVLLADNYLRYMGYPIGTPHSSLADVQFTARELHRLTPEGARANALSLDLREFRRAGGKLILWHGWDDEGIPAVGTLDYYQRLSERNGGLRQTQEWARLFMIPTMFHCGRGYQLTEFDPYRELVAWVERGAAPERIVATGRDEQGTVVRTRPVFPYPLRAAYDGSGSVDDEANFVPARPLVPPGRDKIDWVGTYLHHIPGPVA